MIICWWSGGITSAAACYLSIELFGLEKCRFVFIDTGNEDKDTYRFKKDCEKWYKKEIETITGLSKKFPNIQSVWKHYKSLNVANGAICSSTLKREVRLKWEQKNNFKYQVFGFDINEANRAKSMTLNYPKAKPVYPLLFHGLSKKDCIKILENENIEAPRAYKMGFHNNNCFKTMCIQGGIGYWQKVQRDFPKKFEAMAKMEHELTDLKGAPVTMITDQAKKQKGVKRPPVFLKPHPDYPEAKDISKMKGREPKPLMDCNGFGCAVNDLMPENPTVHEINYQLDLFN